MSSDVNQSSIHSPLDSNRHQLRLLVLHHGQHDELIHCTLKSGFINEQEPYEALSYVWGDATITTPIYIGPLQKPFGVTTNLACALSNLRYQDKDRVLWVDAICIDQSNDNEKSHQVRMMKNIFEGAERVLAWLGPETPGAETAIQTLLLLANNKDLHWRPDGRSDRIGPSVTREQIFGLWAWFQSSDWWTRIWTVQEYAVARELVFLCGRFSIMRKQICELSEHYFAHRRCCPWFSPTVADGQPDAEENLQRIFVEIGYLGDVKAPPSHALQLVCNFRNRKASRPEDKVFGLAGLIDGFDEETIKYGTDVEVVYETFTKFMIEIYQSLDPLTQVTHGCNVPFDIETSTESTGKATLPSWVVNLKLDISARLSFVLSNRYNKLPYYATSGWKDQGWSVSKRGLLSGDGVIWDTIATVGEKLDDSFGRANAAIFMSWYQLATTLPEEYSAGGDLENAFWRTLCADMVIRKPYSIEHMLSSTNPTLSRATNMDYPLFRQWWHKVETATGNYPRIGTDVLDVLDAVSVTEDVAKFDSGIIDSICHRRFIISEKGYIGLAPGIAEPEDRIAVIFGGRVPYILRKNKPDNPENSDNQITWKFLGDSYIHGIMDGEVITKLDTGEVESEMITLQ